MQWTLTDHYKHLIIAKEMEHHLLKCGMDEVKTAYASNGLEASAIMKKTYE